MGGVPNFLGRFVLLYVVVNMRYPVSSFSIVVFNSQCCGHMLEILMVLHVNGKD